MLSLLRLVLSRWKGRRGDRDRSPTADHPGSRAPGAGRATSLSHGTAKWSRAHHPASVGSWTFHWEWLLNWWFLPTRSRPRSAVSPPKGYFDVHSRQEAVAEAVRLNRSLERKAMQEVCSPVNSWPRTDILRRKREPNEDQCPNSGCNLSSRSGTAFAQIRFPRAPRTVDLPKSTRASSILRPWP